MSVPQVAIDAVNYYLTLKDAKGNPAPISKDVAVGIVAVLYAGESALNPGPQGNQSTETGGVLNPNGAYGIASWNGPRQALLQAFAQRYGLNVADINTQLHFVLTESANNYPAVWTAINQPGMTYQNFIPIFVSTYEVPANPQAEDARSMTFATNLYSAVSPVPSPVPPPTPVPTPTPAPTPAPSPNAKEIAFIMALLQLMQQYGVTFT